MPPANILNSALLLFAGSACLIVALLVWLQRRNAAGADALIVLMFALSIWDFTYALFWAKVPGPAPFFWLDLTYIGVLAVPPAFLAFTLQFSGHENWLNMPVIIGMSIVAGIVFILMWTDELHGLFFAGRRTPEVTAILSGGPVFILNIVYLYALILAACVLLVRLFIRSRGLFRRQVALVLSAAALPWIGSILSILGLGPAPGTDNTPFAFSFAALVFAYALWRFHLLDIVPIAHHLLIESMSDGLIVLDAQSRIININPAARRIIANPEDSLIGAPVAAFLAAWQDIYDQFRDVDQLHVEIALGEDSDRHFDLRISPILDRRKQFVGRLIVWRDITEFKLVHAKLEDLARTDMLTRVLNRWYFLDLAEAELKRAHRYSQPLAVALVDIDYFKRINDTYGHSVGDQTLIQFAEVCRKNVREFDLFARLGGDEFVWLMPATSQDGAHDAVERLRKALSGLAVDVGDLRLKITISAGISAPSSGQDTLEMILQRADEALYAAKQSGRNRIITWRASFLD